MKSNRVVIPEKLTTKTIELAHTGHMGIVKTKQLLRTKVWFPNIDKITKQFIKSCQICQAITDTHDRDPIQITNLTSKPFEKLAIDFAGPLPSGKYLFITVDDYSRFPFVEPVNSTDFNSIKRILWKLFTTFSIPEKITSDNGPPFTGCEFKQFAKQCNFKHHRVTSIWPEANGQAE